MSHIRYNNHTAIGAPTPGANDSVKPKRRHGMTSGRIITRSCGVLLPPTSLPGPYGIGDLGPTTEAWIDTLAAAGQTWWQMLPVGPTGYGDSPYQSPSTFAGNLNLISPERLEEVQLASRQTLGESELPDGPILYDE